MSLKIKDKETCRLTGELARLIGKTETDAVTIALRECIERKRRLADRKALAQHLCEIGQSCAPLMGPGPSATEHGDFLYDEQGLPK